MKKEWFVVALAIFSLAVSSFVGYSNNDKAISERVSVVETQQRNDGARLERIERKLDSVLDELRRR